jgi:hypothetical protein
MVFEKKLSMSRGRSKNDVEKNEQWIWGCGLLKYVKGSRLWMR